MARTASKLLEEQLLLVRRILSPQQASGHILAKDIMRLASVTLEIHQRLSSGTPFPSAWLSSPSPLSDSVETSSTDS
jgi:hypothetical protein